MLQEHTFTPITKPYATRTHIHTNHKTLCYKKNTHSHQSQNTICYKNTHSHQSQNTMSEQPLTCCAVWSCGWLDIPFAVKDHTNYSAGNTLRVTGCRQGLGSLGSVSGGPIQYTCVQNQTEHQPFWEPYEINHHLCTAGQSLKSAPRFSLSRLLEDTESNVRPLLPSWLLLGYNTLTAAWTPRLWL